MLNRRLLMAGGLGLAMAPMLARAQTAKITVVFVGHEL
jgi:hypothetical protein